MTDSKECRQHAAHCIEMANNAAGDTKLQTTLYDMAQTWLQLANEAERADALNSGAAAPAPGSSRALTERPLPPTGAGQRLSR